MTLEQLRIFVAVAEVLNMRAAAERLNLTQPAVSAAIAALEERHATRLFDRVGRGLELNDAGRAFLPEARAVLAQAADALGVLDDLAGLKRGDLRIAASQTVATYWLPRRMATFAAAHPGVTLHLEVGNTAQAVAALLAGAADLGFVEGGVDEDLLAIERVGGDRLALYAAPEHPLVGRPLAREDIAAACWVLREQGSGTRNHLEQSLHARFGLALGDLDVRLELPSNGAVLEALGAGGLVTAVSDLAAGPRVEAGLVHELDCALVERDFLLLTHRARRRSRAAQAFLDRTRD